MNMSPPLAIFIIVCAFWVLSEIVIGIRRRAAVTGAESKDRLSLIVMWLAYGGGPFLGGIAAGFPSSRMPVAFRPFAFWGGLALILTGIAIRWTAIATLKRFFTVDVAIAPDHEVIQSGLYGVVRHPSYAGSLISSIGLGLAFLNWISFAIVASLAVAGIAYRIHVEEQALIGALGDEYLSYAARTKRLIPGIY